VTLCTAVLDSPAAVEAATAVVEGSAGIMAMLLPPTVLLRLEGVRSFGDGRVVYAGVRAEPALLEFQRIVNDRLRAAGDARCCD
jgi:2'-5' RNA ligase